MKLRAGMEPLAGMELGAGVDTEIEVSRLMPALGTVLEPTSGPEKTISTAWVLIIFLTLNLQLVLHLLVRPE